LSRHVAFLSFWEHCERDKRGNIEPMETAANSSTDRPAVTRQKDPRKSRITNGSALLLGVDGRSPWIRRVKDLIRAHLSDKPDATAAEQAIIRRAAVLIVELERLERQFALAGETAPSTCTAV
jgi:hypothetical protein